MIPKLEFNPKKFYIHEPIAKKSGNTDSINRILEDLVDIEALLEYTFKSHDGTKMPVYEMNEEVEFLPARGLQAKVFHLIKDRLNNEDEGIPYALIITGCGDKASTIKRKITVVGLRSALIGFYGKSGTLNSFYLAQYINNKNKSLGF
jgi:hypothetical protein